jgi:hypothetical protein
MAPQYRYETEKWEHTRDKSVETSVRECSVRNSAVSTPKLIIEFSRDFLQSIHANLKAWNKYFRTWSLFSESFPIDHHLSYCWTLYSLDTLSVVLKLPAKNETFTSLPWNLVYYSCPWNGYCSVIISPRNNGPDVTEVKWACLTI